MSVRVALDAGPLLDPPTGVGRYVRELGYALGEAGAQVTRYAVAFGGSARAGVDRWRVPARLVHATWYRFGRPSIDSLVGDVDIVHGTNFVLPIAKRAAGVVTIHDLSFLRDDAFPGAAAWARLAPWSIERAARVLTISSTVKDEIVDHYGTDPKKISVTPLGVSGVFFGATPLSDASLGQMGITRPFVLAAGTLEPRKNLARLVEAWRRLDRDDWTLVLAGPKGWGPELPRVRGGVLTGWVGDETLPGLIAASGIFCFPSTYEGFGLPPLEAMATGTPVVAGSYPAAGEILGDAALIVDPLDADEIAEALRSLMDDGSLRSSLARAGRARAAGFTWHGTAAATVAAYRSALDGDRAP